jgi:hypothetical protein
MRRIGIALVFALLSIAPPASARKAVDITPSSIAGIELGMSRTQARALLGRPVRIDRLEDGYERLVSARRKLEVYFRAGVKGVDVVTTWSRARRTPAGVGPCSTVTALKHAYGPRLVRKGRKAYRVGNLVFTAEGGRPVGVVALGRGSAAIYVALNATECR